MTYSTKPMDFRAFCLKKYEFRGLIDEPQPKVESLLSEVLQ